MNSDATQERLFGNRAPLRREAQEIAPYPPGLGVGAQEVAPIISVIPTKWSTRLEGGCPACVAKHLSQVILLVEFHQKHQDDMMPSQVDVYLARSVILDEEARAGYRGHKLHAAGCMALAESLLRRENFQGPADIIRELRLEYTAGKISTLTFALWGKVYPLMPNPRTAPELVKAVAWAHLSEALAELPACDFENRKAINMVLGGTPGTVSEVSRILKSVVETYELEPSNG